MKKLCLINIVILLITSLVFTSCNNNSDGLYQIKKDGKVIYTIDINGDFDDDRILVVMDKETSEINKEYSLKYFNYWNIESIKDLSHIDEGNDLKLVDVDNFQQILCLTLKKKSKKKVIEAIQKIILVKGVQSAEPNGHMHLDEARSN